MLTAFTIEMLSGFKELRLSTFSHSPLLLLPLPPLFPSLSDLSDLFMSGAYTVFFDLWLSLFSTIILLSRLIDYWDTASPVFPKALSLGLLFLFGQTFDPPLVPKPFPFLNCLSRLAFSRSSIRLAPNQTEFAVFIIFSPDLLNEKLFTVCLGLKGLLEVEPVTVILGLSLRPSNLSPFLGLLLLLLRLFLRLISDLEYFSLPPSLLKVALRFTPCRLKLP